MVSEKLQNRINRFMGMGPKGAPPLIQQQQQRIQEGVMPPKAPPPPLTEQESLRDLPMDKTDQENLDLEEQQRLQRLIDKASLQESAEGQMAQQIAMLGEGDDSELAHLRPGEVVLPPEFFDDPDFEQQVEQKFKENNIDPEEAIVGGGIASLNPRTGLEQFGFFKKIGKKLKKFAKKVAPVAGPLANFIPGVGPVLAGAIGAGTNLVAGKGIKGAITGGLSGYGTGKLLGNVANVGGLGDVAFKDAQIGDKFRALGRGFKRGGIRSIFGNRNLKEFAQAGYTPLEGSPGMFVNEQGQVLTEDLLGSRLGIPSGQTTGGFNFVDDVLGIDPGGAGLAGSVRDRLLGGGQGGGGGGGLGLLGTAGIGALAAGLGKLAYEDAKKQQGVALTPLTTMSPTGRYNIEAEIARRMGQPAPNPVEFGLLPEGTLPELSGGKPRAMAYGGSVYGNGIEDLEGGMARGMMMGGPVMAYAKGGAVLMQEGGEMDVESFPRKDGPINGPGTEKSDDIPAMLSDGEFVMTGQAVRGAGSVDINNNNGILSLTPSMEEDRERGMKNMYQMMDFFESNAQPSS